MTPQALLADLRRRIDEIQARSAPPYRRAPGEEDERRLARPAPPPRRPRSLDAIPGAEPAAHGVVLVSSRLPADGRVGTVAPADAAIASPDLAAPLAGLTAPAPRDLLSGLRVLDIETTGLSGGAGTLAFLVGVGRFDEDASLIVDQLILGSPAAEPAFLDRLHALLAGATLLVTFNGRAFDVPILRTRGVLARRPPGALATTPHLDLLAPARRLWRGRCPDCRLVTLEAQVLGRHRPDDMPGSLAPVAYSSYLTTGDATLLVSMIEHNRDDVRGTAALLAAVLRLLDDPFEWAESAAELIAVGEHRLRLGEDARPLLERALELARTPEPRRRALTQLARLHRRSGRTDDARRVWERYRRDFPTENTGFIELAKLLEHRARDPAAALAVAAAAPDAAALALQHRLARLRRRVGAQIP